MIDIHISFPKKTCIAQLGRNTNFHDFFTILIGFDLLPERFGLGVNGAFNGGFRTVPLSFGLVLKLALLPPETTLALAKRDIVIGDDDVDAIFEVLGKLDCCFGGEHPK